jgi:4-amino-4-deoxy-L-arabinose transferase
MKKSGLIVISFFLLLYILPLGVRPMIVPDETRYAEMGREMVETGNWIVPRIDGLRYFEKPILGYWLHALSIKLLGTNAYAVRLPSALAVGLSALILFFFVRRFTSDAVTAIAATVVFLTCLEVYGVGTFCVLDSIFSMFVTATMVLFFFAFTETHSSKKRIFLLSAGIACGLAFLTKGFLAFVIPAVAIIPFAIWQRRFKESSFMFLSIAATAVITALPWSIMIHLKEPDFWHYFFWTENIGRFVSPVAGEHPHPFWFYIPFILGGTLPWTVQIAASIYKHRKMPSKDPLYCFALCWFLFPFLFFSISKGKLGTYILPCFPPLIVLFVISLRQEFTISKYFGKRFNRSEIAGIVVIIALIVVLILTQTVITKTKIYNSSEAWKWLLLTIGLFIYAGFLMLAAGTVSNTRKFAFSCLAPALVLFSGHFATPNRLMEKKAPSEFLIKHKDRINQESTIVSDNYLASAICWNYKRSDIYFLDRTGEFDYGLQYEDSHHRLINIKQLKKMIAESSGENHVIMIMLDYRYSGYKDKLPKPVYEDIRGRLVFAEFANESTSNI